METEDPEQVAAFFQVAFDDWMNDPRIIAATPLFWHPDTGDFWMYSLGKNGGIKTTSPTYHRLKAMRRVRGTPEYVPIMANTLRMPRAPEPVAGPPERLEGAAVADPPTEPPADEREPP